MVVYARCGNDHLCAYNRQHMETLVMVQLENYRLNKTPTISKALDQPITDWGCYDFYDKDGFELNLAERAYYKHSNIQLHDCLNHICCQQKWLDITSDTVWTDHALILHRYDYADEALKQIRNQSVQCPPAGWIIQTRRKWGFDLAVDATSMYGQAFEVVHIEYDECNYETFREELKKAEEQIERMDWDKAAQQVWNHRDHWMYLKGFQQNHWKAKYLFGWAFAEYTEKAA